MFKWQKLQSHYVAVVFAIFIALISVAPQIYVLQDAGYKGIQMFGADAEYDYVAKVNKAQYADYSKGPFPPDKGKNYYLAPQLGERMMALAAKILHVRAIDINVIFKFLSAAVLFLLIYFWVLYMSSSKEIALIASLFVLLGTNLFDPAEIFRMISLKTGIDSFLPYTRPISPQISSFFLFGGLWGIYRLVYGDYRLRIAIVIGLISGLSLYSYIYTWTFLTVLLGLYFIHLIAQKKYERAKNIFYALLANGALALPFFINLLKARVDIDYADTALRIGAIHSRAPVFGLLFALACAALVFLWPREHKNVKYFFLFNIAALAVVLNQQLITGLKLQPGHYHWYVTKPLLALIASFLALCWAQRIWAYRGKAIMAVLLAIVFLANAAVIQAHSYSANYSAYAENQRYAPLLSFLDAAYPQKKNIWTEHNLSTLIMAYTRHNAPDNAHAMYYIASQKHLRDMVFLEYRLKGVEAEDIAGALDRDREYVTARTWGIYYRDLPGTHEISDVELNSVAAGYREFLKIPLEGVLKDMDIDIIVVDSDNDKPELDKAQFLTKITAGKFLVYQRMIK
jgi:hypothetical protein